MLAFALFAAVYLAQLFGTNTPPLNPTPVTAGAFIGGFANSTVGNKSAAQREANLEAIESQIGRRYAFQLHYYGLTSLTTQNLKNDPTVQGDIRFGRFPLFSETCNTPLVNYYTPNSSGVYPEDALLIANALALKSLRVPVALRWFHEFNLCLSAAACANGDNPQCFTAGTTDLQKGQQFIAAFEHIRSVYAAQGVTNVAFMWCPNGNANDLANHALIDYLPPLNTIDYIAWDVYDKLGLGFVGTMTPFYSAFSGQGKPMFITETGEFANDAGGQWSQAQYWQDIASNLQTNFPLVHGVSYFSSDPSGFDWRLDAQGIAALSVTANSAYFNVFAHP